MFEGLFSLLFFQKNLTKKSDGNCIFWLFVVQQKNTTFGRENCEKRLKMTRTGVYNIYRRIFFFQKKLTKKSGEFLHFLAFYFGIYIMERYFSIKI